MEQTLPLRLPDAMLAALRQTAREEDCSVGDLVRDAISRDLRRRAQAKTPVRADERLVAPLRALLADDLAYAQSWDDLATRLACKGFRLRESGGGLILERNPSGERLCKASELGYSYSALLRRFDQAFPGHSHTATLARVRVGDAREQHR
jgi:hypothetical protein